MTIIVPLAAQAGKTFLQLCQRVVQEVAASGAGPSTVIGQTGEYRRIVDWVAEADQEIQREHDSWRFMVDDFAINTVVGVTGYAASQCTPPVVDLRKWKERRIKCYLLAAGVTDEQLIPYIDYDEWYRRFATGPQSNSRPMFWTYGNEMELLIGPPPADVYRVSGEYQKSCGLLINDADVPNYPPEFHMLPVYLAMVRYGYYTGAPEVIQNGQRLYSKMLAEMRRTQLPRMNTFRPLA